MQIAQGCKSLAVTAHEMAESGFDCVGLILNCILLLSVRLRGYWKILSSANTEEARDVIGDLELAEIVSLDKDAKRVTARFTNCELALHDKYHTCHIGARLKNFLVRPIESRKEWRHHVVNKHTLQLAEEQIEFAFEWVKEFNYNFWS
jgi:hypothetical protein